MHPRKKKYANEVFNLTTQVCSEMSEEKDSPISVVLNISTSDAREIINKIMIALPDEFFFNATSTMLYDMIALITKNLILFQVQENIDDDEYVYHLIDFINALTLIIQARYYSR